MFQTTVPEDYWSAYLDPDADLEVAIVACGCGETAWAGGAVIGECACGRFFLFLGDELRCFKPEPDDGAEEAEDPPGS